MVFQDPLASLNPVFQVGHQIEDVVRIHKGVSTARVARDTRKALAEVGLPASDETLKRYPHQFSGGMRQRVCMAMALACGSPLLIADEPTTALDVTIQAQILRPAAQAARGAGRRPGDHHAQRRRGRADLRPHRRDVRRQRGRGGAGGGSPQPAAAPLHHRALRVSAARPHRLGAADHPGHRPRPHLTAHRLSLPSALQARARRLPDHQASSLCRWATATGSPASGRPARTSGAPDREVAS